MRTAATIKYASGCLSSGMFTKFMPYQPVTSASGVNTVSTMVSMENNVVLPHLYAFLIARTNLHRLNPRTTSAKRKSASRSVVTAIITFGKAIASLWMLSNT